MKEKKVIIIFIAIPLIAILFALSFILIRNNSTSMEVSLPFDNYIDYPLSYAGNSYSFAASIISQLAYSDTRGRIILVNPKTANIQLPIYVPPTIKNFNPQVNQVYILSISIDSEGKLVLTDFKKI